MDTTQGSVFVDDQPWSFEVTGRGPSILLLHGLGASSFAWRRLLPELHERGMSTLSIDIRGYGIASLSSTTPLQPAVLMVNLNEALDLIGIATVLHVGHSFGAALLLGAAKMSFPSIRPLVLVAPGGFGPEINPFAPPLANRIGQAINATLIRTGNRLHPRVLNASRDPRLTAEQTDLDLLRAKLVDGRARANYRAAYAQVRRSIATRDLLIGLAQLDSSQIYALWGSRDQILPSWQSELFARLLPRAGIEVVEGAGHSLQVTHARLLAERITGRLL